MEEGLGQTWGMVGKFRAAEDSFLPVFAEGMKLCWMAWCNNVGY
jgi:hypothetical protein